jgi:hypothetical protein
LTGDGSLLENTENDRDELSSHLTQERVGANDDKRIFYKK